MKKRRSGGGARYSEDPLVSIRLDPLLWEALHDIAKRQGCTARDLTMAIARDSLSIAIRIYIEEFYRAGAAQAEPSDPEPR